jgi:nucleoside-diphosphate-sugar epimerase
MADAIAITGATGFIGGAIINRLAAGGRRIQALIRPESIHKKPDSGSVTWIHGDLDDANSLKQLVNGAATVVHCAGVVRGSTAEHFTRVNTDGVAHLARAVREQEPTPRFLMISSLAAREPQLSAYAASKHQGEKALIETAGNIGWTVYRPSAVYGPGDREILPVLRWMSRGVAPLLGSGDGRFSMIYIEDLADAIVQWLDRPFGHQSTFELHDGKPGGYCWHEIINMMAALRGAPVVRLKIPVGVIKFVAMLNIAMARVFGYAPMLTPGKVRELSHSDWSVDNAEISETAGWSPKIELAEGLRRTLGWNRN